MFQLLHLSCKSWEGDLDCLRTFRREFLEFFMTKFFFVLLINLLSLGGVMSKEITTESGLKYEVLKEADAGAQKPEKGNMIEADYEGVLEDGTKFDSSYDRGEPITFQVGIGQVIQGWDEALLDMKVGEERKLTIPSELGYGPRGAGAVIPPNATLIFKVRLNKIV